MTQAVVDNVIDAGIHYQLYRDLLAAVPVFEREMNEARAFWQLTLIAHRDAAVMRLCRVFDGERRALSIGHWLEIIAASKGLFSEAAFRERLTDSAFVDSLAAVDRVPKDSDLRNDWQLVSNDLLVRRLLALRNNVFAHLSVDQALNPSVIVERFRLEAEEVQILIDGALRIVNKYSSLFEARTFAARSPSYDDYLSVLRALARDLSDYERRIREEAEAAGWTDLPEEFPHSQGPR